MPRLRQVWLALPLGIAALTAGLAAATGNAAAQTLPDTSYRILRPVLDGDPNNPPRFRKPARAAGAGEPVPYAGYVPTFGNPPAAGAGDTGFISTGGPRKKRRPGAPAAKSTAASPGAAVAGAQAGPEPPDVAPPPGPATAPPPPGVTRAAATSTRIGGPPIPGGIPSDPFSVPHRRPPPEGDPYDPLGLRLGSFLVHSAVEVTTGDDTNPSRAPAGSAPSWFVSVAPELHARSQWSRHEVSADVLATYAWYQSAPTADRPNLDAKLNGRIDVTSHDRIDLQGRFLLSTDYPGSPNVPLDIARQPIYTDVGATAGFGHTFNRLDLSLKGAIDRFNYQPSLLSDGSLSSNDDRNYNQYAMQLRGSYEFNPGFKPFVALDLDERLHDLPYDRIGLQRDSRGYTPRVGAALDWGGSLRGEVSFGYTTRVYKDPTLADLRGILFDASLVWNATGLTTATLSAQSFVDESVLPGVSGVLRDSVTLQIDHAFRRWLIGTARLGDEIDEYQGSPRVDHRRLASLGLTYKLTRTLQIKGEVRHEWLNSNIPGQDYSADVFMVGMRAQN